MTERLIETVAELTAQCYAARSEVERLRAAIEKHQAEMRTAGWSAADVKLWEALK